jgi:CheY-like chemotaxis protein
MRSVPVRHSQAQAKILLVDDNPDGILARRSVLEELGYQIVTAASGSDALAVAESVEVDLVVTDFKMEPVDGLQLISRLRERNFARPIILLTGFADSVGMTPQTTGADAVIQKSANEIAALVRQAKRLLSVPRKPPGSHSGARGRSKAQTAK